MSLVVVAGRCPPQVNSRFPSLVELLSPSQSRHWCRGSTSGVIDRLVVCRRASSRVLFPRPSKSGSPVTSQLLLSRFAVNAGGGSIFSAAGRCSRVVGPRSPPRILCPLRRSRRVPNTIISLILPFVRLPPPLLFHMCFSAPPRFLRYATIH